MIEPVVIVGLNPEGVSGLGRLASVAVRNAHFVAGGRRHLRLLGPTDAETFAVTDNLDELVGRLAGRGPGERCVVLASGDPLFFGVGHRIIEALGREHVRVETALSSMQLAFARVGLSWHDATIVSVHGRPLKPTLLPLLGRPK
ncbi:MAG: precorrin-6y C5,15-methyltransferase (decarboxylating) subunit CbiE, partial [Planctomycetia bacterium]|nr:precorrin-6y C5,15-methyltransferase (decarboxylating) subunit CbiE [Planctomycetia bacterium]